MCLYSFKLILSIVSAEVRWLHLCLFASSKDFALRSYIWLGSLFCETRLIYVLVLFCMEKLWLASFYSWFSMKFPSFPSVPSISIRTWRYYLSCRITSCLKVFERLHFTIWSLLLEWWDMWILLASEIICIWLYRLKAWLRASLFERLICWRIRLWWQLLSSIFQFWQDISLGS